MTVLMACAMAFGLSAVLPISPTHRRLLPAHIVLAAACIGVAAILALLDGGHGAP